MYSWIAKISDSATSVCSPPDKEVTSKYLPCPVLTNIPTPPSKGSFLFSTSSVTCPFVESCAKFREKSSFSSCNVLLNVFFFFMSIVTQKFLHPKCRC